MFIPEVVEFIKVNPFASCLELLSINASSGSKSFMSVNGVLFSKDMIRFVSFPEGKSFDYDVPMTIKTIEAAAFEGCSMITGV